MDVREIIRRAGGTCAVAKKTSRSHSTVSLWKRVPAEIAVDVAAMAGISPEQVRPDIFREPRIDRRMEGGAL